MARRTHEQIVNLYLKEYDRIRKQISRMEKRGYDVTGLKPKRVARKDITAKELEKLQKLSNESIYQKAAGGTEKKKEEASRRAKKGWRTRRRTEQRKKSWKEGQEGKPLLPRPKPGPKEPGEIPVLPGVPGELSDEEEAALTRFDELFDSFIEPIRDNVQSWKANMISRLGGSLKKFASMLVRALNGGLILKWYPPSQQYAYSVEVMETIQNYLPDELSDEDREQSEDEWQDLINQVMEDEDFLGFD